MAKINRYICVIFGLCACLYSCKESNERIVPIISKDSTHIGDSLFVDGTLSKIVFTDSTLYIDSL